MNTGIFKFDEVRVEKSDVGVAQPFVSIAIQGNNAYKTIEGFAVLVLKEDGSIYNGSVDVGITTTDGHTLLPTQPYLMIRPSMNEKYEDRIIKITPQKGFGRDFKFNFNFTGNAEALKVYALAYFTRNQ